MDPQTNHNIFTYTTTNALTSIQFLLSLLPRYKKKIDLRFFFSKIKQLTMDKIKRTAKILKKKEIKNWLKPVDNLEKSHFVIIENPKCVINSLLIKTEDFHKAIDRGESYPIELIHYVALKNKRDQKAVIKIYFLVNL